MVVVVMQLIQLAHANDPECGRLSCATIANIAESPSTHMTLVKQ
jgi:hypothetical protein